MLQKMENCLKKIPKYHSRCLKSFLSFGNFLVIFENHENRKKKFQKWFRSMNLAILTQAKP